MSPGRYKPIRSVERAIDVLNALAQADAPVSVTDLERTLGLSRPTLYRLLGTLEGRGVVRSNGAPARFSLGHRVVELSGAWLAANDLVSIAQPYLTDLWQESGETVAMFVLGDGAAKICVQELQSREALVFKRGVGFTEPVTVGSSGKAILAFMKDEEIERALAEIVDADARQIREQLQRIRDRGYALSESEIIIGATAMAAPLFDRLGIVQGCVSVFGPDARLSGVRRDTCLSLLRRTANEISAATGYRPSAAAE
jgi:DNA-binding IclR family transcriptional regulator